MAQEFILIFSSCLATVIFSQEYECSGWRSCQDSIAICDGTQDCILRCSGAQSCRQSAIACPPNYKCIVECSGIDSCKWSTTNPGDNGICHVECSGLRSCAPAYFNKESIGAKNYELIMDCDGQNSCHWDIDGRDASSMQLNGCKRDSSCLGKIFCPQNVNGTKKCTITGDDFGGSADNKLELYAVNGWNDIEIESELNKKKGKLYCTEDYSKSCDILVTGEDEINLWTCDDAGDTTCNFDPTQDPTMLPTNQPTTDPTGFPTWIPSNVPTLPTFNPTSIPTINPTTPTNDPSSNPTMLPTVTPTVIPTFLPTTSSDEETLILTVAVPTKKDFSEALEPTLSPEGDDGGLVNGEEKVHNGDTVTLKENDIILAICMVTLFVLLVITIAFCCFYYGAQKQKREMIRKMTEMTMNEARSSMAMTLDPPPNERPVLNDDNVSDETVLPNLPNSGGNLHVLPPKNMNPLLAMNESVMSDGTSMYVVPNEEEMATSNGSSPTPKPPARKVKYEGVGKSFVTPRDEWDSSSSDGAEITKTVTIQTKDDITLQHLIDETKTISLADV